MGTAYLQKGDDTRSAEEVYQRCKDIKEDFYLAYYGMAKVRIQQNDEVGALEEIERCLRYKPGYQYAVKIQKQLQERKNQAEKTRLRG